MATRKHRTYGERELFSATCGMPSWEPAPDDLVQKWRSHLALPIPYGHAEAVEAWRTTKDELEAALKPWPLSHHSQLGRMAPCTFTTEDRDDWLRHTLEVHGGKPGQGRDKAKPDRYTTMKAGCSGPLTGRGFRLRSLTEIEKTFLGRWVEIQRYADTEIRAQIISLADRSLIGGRKPVFAYDESGQPWAFDVADEQPTAYRLDPSGPGLTPTRAGVVDLAPPETSGPELAPEESLASVERASSSGPESRLELAGAVS